MFTFAMLMLFTTQLAPTPSLPLAPVKVFVTQHFVTATIELFPIPNHFKWKK